MLRLSRSFSLCLRLLAALTAFSGIASGASVPSPETEETLSRRFLAMGTEWHLELHGRSEALVPVSEAVIQTVERFEALLSTWRNDSFFSTVNRTPPGEAVAVPADLHETLDALFRLRAATMGAFEPAIGALVAAWDLRGEGRTPDAKALQTAVAAVRAGVSYDPATRQLVRNHEHALLDAGGFGKGAALEAIQAMLRSEASIAWAKVSAGGQLLLHGEGACDHPVVIRESGDAPIALRARPGSFATTSQVQRFVTIEGAPVGHVLDPRSGQPVDAWRAVTVYAESPLAADVLSTACFVLGPGNCRQLFEDGSRRGLVAIEGKASATNLVTLGTMETER